MASITCSAELLRQPFQEKLLEEAKHFATAYDALFNPIIFVLQKNGVLSLLASSADGDIQVVNLNQQLEIADSEHVTTFAISQVKSGSIFVVLATENSQGTSRLLVLRPISPNNKKWYEDISQSEVIQGQQNPDLAILKLLLSPSDEGTGYPFLAAEIRKHDKLTRDIARVDVRLQQETWSWAQDLEFSYNLEGVVDFCAGRIRGASGVFVIDDTQGESTLTFVGIDDESPIVGSKPIVTVHLPIVANPKTVTTISDDQGLSNVLVGGDGILHLPAKHCVTSVVSAGTIWEPTLTHEALKGLHKLTVAQCGKDISLWALNSEDNLVGQSAILFPDEDYDDEGSEKLIGRGVPVPLLPGANHLQTFDAVLHPQRKSQEVLCLTQGGLISRLTQSGDSKLWSQRTLRVPDPNDVKDINTYACQIKVMDKNNWPLVDYDVLVQSSSQTPATANGIKLYLDQHPKRLKTDSRGMIALVLPAPDLVVPNITLSSQGSETFTFNPAAKAIERLTAAAKNGQLARALRPDGSKIFTETESSTALAFTQLGNLYSEKASMSNMAAADIVQPPVTNAISNADTGILWQLWHGIVAGVEKIVELTYEAGVFIIKTVKNVWNFVIETAEHVLSAISALLSYITEKVEDALFWLARELDWAGITDMMLFFNETFNASIDLMRDLIEQGSDAVDSVFNGFEESIASWHLPPKLPANVAQSKPDVNKPKQLDMAKYTGDPEFSWVDNHVESGDSKDRIAAADAKADSTDLSDVLQSLINDIFLPLWENFKDTLMGMWDDAKPLFDDSSTLTWQDILQNLGTDLLLGIVRGVHKLIHGLLAVSSKLLGWIQSMANTALDIPVLSKVFYRITDGQQLTMLNLVSLTLAVPTHYMFKALYGKKPRDIPQLASFFDEIRNRRDGHAFGPVIVTARNTSQTNQLEPKLSVATSLQTHSTSLTTDKLPEFKLKATHDVVGEGSGKYNEERAQADFEALWDHDGAQNISNVIHVPSPGETSSSMLISQRGNSDTAASPVIRNSEKNSSVLLDIHKLKARPSVSWIDWLWRLGGVFKNIGIYLYSSINAVITGFYWPVMKANIAKAKEAPKELKAKTYPKGRTAGIIWSVIMTGLSFPSSKFGRADVGVGVRIFAWGVTGVLNIIKSFADDVKKPWLAAYAGVFDAACYGVVLVAEGLDGDSDCDGPWEWSQRFASDTWAVGSCWCGLQGAAEPYGLAITIAASLVANGEAFVLMCEHTEEFERNGWNEDYVAPSIASGLSGAFV